MADFSMTPNNNLPTRGADGSILYRNRDGNQQPSVKDAVLEADALIKTHDRNRDGQLSRQEVLSGLGPRAAMAFNGINLDRSQNLDLAELSTFVLFSDAPQAALDGPEAGPAADGVITRESDGFATRLATFRPGETLVTLRAMREELGVDAAVAEVTRPRTETPQPSQNPFPGNYMGLMAIGFILALLLGGLQNPQHRPLSA